MRTSAVGSDPAAGRASDPTPGRLLVRGDRGFTLVELMLVLALMAIVGAAALLAMRDAPQVQLEREADRLAALLESARAQSRVSGQAILWQSDEAGFAFFRGAGPGADDAPATGEMLDPPLAWLEPQVRALPGAALLLGPEPIIQARSITLVLQGRSLSLASDGLRPFAVIRAEAGQGSATP